MTTECSTRGAVPGTARTPQWSRIMRDLDEQSQRYGNPSLAHIRLRAHLPPGSPVLAEALAALALWRAGL